MKSKFFLVILFLQIFFLQKNILYANYQSGSIGSKIDSAFDYSASGIKLIFSIVKKEAKRIGSLTVLMFMNVIKFFKDNLNYTAEWAINTKKELDQEDQLTKND